VPEVIPYLSVVEQMARHRAPVPAFAPHSPAAAAYADLWTRLRSGLADGR
jgi:hypothetical protein